MIQKNIISIWIGSDTPPDLIQKCLNTAKIEGFNHVFIDNRTDLSGIPSTYLKACLAAKKWAKAADWLRLYFLYENGGVYLDADMEVLYPEKLAPLLDNDLFVCKEENGFIANSAIGACKGHPLLKMCLEEMEKMDGSDDKVFEYGMELFTKHCYAWPSQVKILTPDYFFPYNHETGENKETLNTICIHHFYKTWKELKPCEELATYLKRPLPIVTERCKYAPIELAWRWPEYKDNVLDFYRENDLYLFDLTLYHDILMPGRGTHEWFCKIIQKYGIQTVLDYGGGIGEWTIQANKAGAKCDYLDVDGVMKDYAKWRFGRRGISASFLKEDDEFGTYDLIAVMDTLEHIPEPEPIIKKLSEKAKYIICNPEEIPYNWVYPCHVSRFDLTPYFEKVESYLWKSRFFQSS